MQSGVGVCNPSALNYIVLSKLKLYGLYAVAVLVISRKNREPCITALSALFKSISHAGEQFSVRVAIIVFVIISHKSFYMNLLALQPLSLYH